MLLVSFDYTQNIVSINMSEQCVEVNICQSLLSPFGDTNLENAPLPLWKGRKHDEHTETKFYHRSNITEVALCTQLCTCGDYKVFNIHTENKKNSILPVDDSAVNSDGAGGDTTQRKLQKKSCAGKTEHLTVIETLNNLGSGRKGTVLHWGKRKPQGYWCT